MLDGPAVVGVLESRGVTHVAWVPDSHLGTWEPALLASPSIQLLRACREGEVIALAAGLLLGGANPVAAMQCTGFFEAGDALRNVVHDLNLPLKLIVGVRSFLAYQKGQSADNCPRFAEPVVAAWDVPFSWIDPTTQDAGVLTTALDRPGAGIILWAE